jgi:hypothetical protein
MHTRVLDKVLHDRKYFVFDAKSKIFASFQ